MTQDDPALESRRIWRANASLVQPLRAQPPQTYSSKKSNYYRKHPHIANESREASMPSSRIGWKHADAQKFQTDCARCGTSIGWRWFRLLIMVVPSLLPPAAVFLPDRLLLFCLPYAGASASVYREWVRMAPEFLQVCPVELPGKGRLITEPFARSLNTLARMISEEVSDYADRPYAIFGHSMGALLAYEVAAQLESVGQPYPFRIFLSGALPPFLAGNRQTVSDLPNAPFLDHLRELQGTPEAILDNQDLMQFFLPVLRSDFRLCEEYEASEPHLLQVPVTALSGEQDENTPEADMLLWKRATTGAFESRRYPGGHFFFSDPNVMWSVFDSLQGWQGKQRMSMAGAGVRGA